MVLRRLPGANGAKRLPFLFRSPSCNLSKRFLATGEPEEYTYGKKPLRAYTPSPPSQPIPLRTLYRGWLKPEDYVDLSDSRGIIVDPRTGLATGQSNLAPYISYGRSERRLEDSWLIKFPIGGAVRFRLTQTPDPRGQSFAGAQDLLTEHGTPWEIPLLAIVSSPRYDFLQDVLLLDGYFPDGALEDCQALCNKLDVYARVGQFSQFVYETLQPFHLNLAKPTAGLILVGGKSLIPLTQRELFSANPVHNSPFKAGSVLCRFEAQGPPFVFIRVLRVIEPIEMAEDYKGPIDKPVVGDYVRRNGKPMSFLHERRDGGTPKYQLWTSKPKTHLSYLWNWFLCRKRAEKQGIHFPWDKEAIRPPSARH